MYWINGKPFYGNNQRYKKEKKDAEIVREAVRLVSNHLIKPNTEIGKILSQLVNHKYYYIYEAMEQQLTVKKVMKQHKITESQYFKQQKEFFLLFYQLYQLREVR
jgi:hypothetical protein